MLLNLLFLKIDRKYAAVTLALPTAATMNVATSVGSLCVMHMSTCEEWAVSQQTYRINYVGLQYTGNSIPAIIRINQAI